MCIWWYNIYCCLLSDLINQLPYDHPARMYYKSIEIAPEKTYGSILSSLQSKLFAITSTSNSDDICINGLYPSLYCGLTKFNTLIS